MVIECLQEELQRIFGCSVEISASCLKRGMWYLGFYGALMLITFALTLVMPLFGMLLVIELILISTILSFILFLNLIYYGIYFGRKAWHRAEPQAKKIQISDQMVD